MGDYEPIETLNIAFDEGASWIHGIDGNPIFTLANKAGMDTFETKDESRINYDFGGKERSSAIYQKAEDELYEILDSLMKSGSANQSFKTVFNNLHPSNANNRLWKFLLSTYITFDCGDLDKLSSLHYNEGEEYSGAEKIVTNGYDTIANYLAKGLNIQLNQKVTKIDYTKKQSKNQA